MEMIKKEKLIALALILISNLSFMQNTYSQEKCALQKNETLVIGCTYECGPFMKWGLKRAARRLGYKIEIRTLTDNSINTLKAIDGILIPGGADINPKYYTPFIEDDLKKHIENLDSYVNYTSEGERRDPFEYKLLENYFSEESLKTTPILGICRGMQMLTVSQKIPLYIDIKKELGIKNRQHLFDKVSIIDSNSKINGIATKNKFLGYELHHQGLRLDYFNKYQSRWPNLKISALSNNGKIVEGLEFTDRPILGVQFHPEYTLTRSGLNFFKWFLSESCKKKGSL